jgi:hypothetical protein
MGPTLPTVTPAASRIPAVSTQAASLPSVTPGAAASPPVSAFPSLKEVLANDELRNLQANYQDLLGKEAQNAGTVHQLQSKISKLSGSIDQDLPRLQEKYNDLLRRHQSLLQDTMDAKGSVLRAINLPFHQVHEFDGSDAVITDTKKKAEESPAICHFADTAEQVF